MRPVTITCNFLFTVVGRCYDSIVTRKSVENMRRPYFLLLCALVVASCWDCPIAKYAPVDPAEKEIMAFLIQYQDAKNLLDVEKLLSLLHDNGVFTFHKPGVD